MLSGNRIQLQECQPKYSLFGFLFILSERAEGVILVLLLFAAGFNLKTRDKMVSDVQADLGLALGENGHMFV